MITQIQSAFYTKLKNWETTASTASSTFNTQAPPTASLPYCIFGLLTETPIGDFADFEAIENLTFYINCFSSKSIADVSSMADQVIGVLDDATISASGFTDMKCVREFMGQPIANYSDNVLTAYQIPLRYRIWLDKT